jgi:hypothetical protein
VTGDKVTGDKVTGDKVTRGQSDRGQSDRGQSDRGQSERGKSVRKPLRGVLRYILQIWPSDLRRFITTPVHTPRFLGYGAMIGSHEQGT